MSIAKRSSARVLLGANPDNDGIVRYSDHIVGQGQKFWSKRVARPWKASLPSGPTPYEQYRSQDWLKVKCTKQQEFVIGGYSKPEGSRVGFGALLLGYYDKKDFVYAGRVGTGFTAQSLKELTAQLKKRQVVKPAFNNPPRGADSRGVTWVKPELVGEVEFTEWTSDGRLRHPSFNGLREDKPAKQVVREQEKSPSKLTRSDSRISHPSSNGKVHMATKSRTASKKQSTASRKTVRKSSSGLRRNDHCRGAALTPRPSALPGTWLHEA